MADAITAPAAVQKDQHHADPTSSSAGPQLTEKEKMIQGQLYYSFGPELCAERAHARSLLHTFNTTLGYTDEKGRQEVLKMLLGSFDDEHPPFLEPPFRCDYGYNIHMGKDVYMNFNCVILDCCPVKIGSRVLFGPNVQVYTATHPLDGNVRRGTTGPELAKPIEIGDDVWVGGGAIILPGVKVGNGAVVGAGSVVTKDVPANTVVAGNPARYIKDAK